MTRSRCGWLGLHRTTLSFATSQRLFGAYGIVTSNVYWYCNRWFGALHRVDASTRHPRMGAAERCKVTAGELAETKSVRRFAAQPHFSLPDNPKNTVPTVGPFHVDKDAPGLQHLGCAKLGVGCQ